MAVVAYRNTDEYAFKNIKVMVDGVPDSTVTLNGITYSKNVERGYTYGEGSKPRSIQDGNESYAGTITVLQSDLEKLIQKNITDGYFDITVSYQKGNIDPMIVDTIENVKVNSFEKGMAQGDQNSTHTIDFIALNIKFGSAA